MTILAIIKGRGREAIDAATIREIEVKLIHRDIFGSTQVEIEDHFTDQLSKWFMEDYVLGKDGYPIGTLLFFTKSKMEA